MRHWLCVICLLLGTNGYAEPLTTQPGIESLSWMVGSWNGALGPQTVEETWSSPRAGSMDAMIRLSTRQGVQMIELIVIREVELADGEDSLVLHLRQFSPTLELRTSQDMSLQAIAVQSVSFVAEDSAAIHQLTYTLVAKDHLAVDVSFANGEAFTAHLQPN